MPSDNLLLRAALIRLQAELERKAFGFMSTSTTAASNDSVLDARKFLGEWEKLLRNARRSQVTFVVDRAHQGPPMLYGTPGDGERIEMSWADANAVHQDRWPLALLKVLSVDAAEFRPASLGEFVTKHLAQPPYELPPTETFEEWWGGPAGA